MRLTGAPECLVDPGEQEEGYFDRARICCENLVGR